MKLRIRGDSLRLRLTRSEVQRLDETGEVRETIHFGPSALDYVLRRGEGSIPHAHFEGSSISVELPRESVEAWARSDQVSIVVEQELPEGQLRLLIEKDFKCLAPREGTDEDDSDAFPHPGAATGASC